jgi:glycosyltransferase involved in cell wall biosynthesis
LVVNPKLAKDQPVICHLADYAAAYSGTFLDALLSLARYCRQQLSIETLLLFPENAKGRDWLSQVEREGVRYGFLPRSHLAVSELRKAVGPNQPAIIHSHFTLYDETAILFRSVFCRRASVIWHFHATGKFTLAQRVKDIAKVGVFARYFTDRFIAVGDGTFQYALARGIPSSRLHLIQNGINTSRFQPDSARRLRIRQHLGIPEKALAFLLLGWQPKRKGVDLFVKAAAKLAENQNHANVFLIVGSDDTKRAVEELPHDSKAGPALQIIPSREDFPGLLDAIDVFVSASRSEGLSYAMAEAMAAGRIVLTSDIPGVREAFGGSPGVWLFPNEDWMSLMQMMQRSAELSASERANLGRANLRYAAEKLSLDAWTENIGNVYRELLATRLPHYRIQGHAAGRVPYS